jgi:hypothetical protein
MSSDQLGQKNDFAKRRVMQIAALSVQMGSIRPCTARDTASSPLSSSAAIALGGLTETSIRSRCASVRMRPFDAGDCCDHRADDCEPHPQMHGPPAEGAATRIGAHIRLRRRSLARRSSRLRPICAQQLGAGRLSLDTTAPNPRDTARVHPGGDGGAGGVRAQSGSWTRTESPAA